jgi:hypothetical protein
MEGLLLCKMDRKIKFYFKPSTYWATKISASNPSTRLAQGNFDIYSDKANEKYINLFTAKKLDLVLLSLKTLGTETEKYQLATNKLLVGHEAI